jgi:hypothetical protein
MLPPPPVLAPPDGAIDGVKVTDGVGVAVATAETVGVGVTLAGGLAGGLAGVVGVWQVLHVGVGVGGGVWWHLLHVGSGVGVCVWQLL